MPAIFLRFRNRKCRSSLSAVFCPGVITLLIVTAHAQPAAKLDADLSARVDRIVQQTLTQSGVPSASIAVVKDGQLAYVHAYGQARLEPAIPARPEMRYSIGSISKQFTAAAILMLAEEGKLSVDDPVGKYVPDLTRASEVTIRQLLSHTSGYQDYWPQDYVPPFMSRPITSQKILDLWARKPLDFDPGTRWQYSNTNYVIAGLIVEKVGGRPLLTFLQERVFGRLGMNRVDNIDEHPFPQTDASGYMRYALGPLRIAPKEGAGWLFAAGELAMPAEDLAQWDIAMLKQSLLKPASYREMETEVKLKDGSGTGYGLGVMVNNVAGRRLIRHGGEVSGFTAANNVYLDDNCAVVVFTNQDAVSASSTIARQVGSLLLGRGAGSDDSKLNQARKIFAGLQEGKIDRAQFTANANAYFSEQALKDFAQSLGPLGQPLAFIPTGEQLRGGMTFRAYRTTFQRQELAITIFEMPDGKLEQYLVAPAN